MLEKMYVEASVKPRPPCELIVRYVLPTLRALIAKELIEKHKFSQVEVAKKLGTTQATISQYLCSKRGGKYLKQIESMQDVKTAVAEIAEGIATGKMSTTNATLHFCSVCKKLRRKLSEPLER